MKKNYLIVILTGFLFTACAAQPMYKWGDYSSSLYKWKKEPNESNLQSHKQVLVTIMEDSKQDGLRVPPGVYCEYGYLLLNEGNKDEALKYFDMEEQTYPESTIFIQRLKTQLNKVKE